MGSLVEQLNFGVWVGLALQLLGRIAYRGEGNIGIVLGLIGLLFLIWGSMRIAVEKGYSKWVGLIGIFSCGGLLVLLILPDRDSSV